MREYYQNGDNIEYNCEFDNDIGKEIDFIKSHFAAENRNIGTGIINGKECLYEIIIYETIGGLS